MRSILAVLALCVVKCVGGIKEGNFRSSFFNTLPEHRLTGHVFKTITAGSQLSCAQKCLAHDACKSCNFRTSGERHSTCELSSRGPLPQTHDPDLAHDKEFVLIYVENVNIFVSISFFIFHRSQIDCNHRLNAIFKRSEIRQDVVNWKLFYGR